MKQKKRLPKGHAKEKLFWMTPDEFAAELVGLWVTIPRDRTDAFLARGVRTQISREMALAEHSEMIATELMFGSTVPVASIRFHGLSLPKGYVPKGDLYVKRKRKTGKKRNE